VCQGIEEEEEVLGVFSPAQQVHTRQTLYLGRERRKNSHRFGWKTARYSSSSLLSFFF
jgi:hypothetical protein